MLRVRDLNVPFSTAAVMMWETVVNEDETPVNQWALIDVNETFHSKREDHSSISRTFSRVAQMLGRKTIFKQF